MTREPDQIREQFLDRLMDLDTSMTGLGIPYAIIGSLAVSAYVDGGAAAEFARKHAHHGWQRIPDIDLLVPRSTLSEVQRYAETSKAASFSVKIDSAPAQGYIDYRPNAHHSYLTHRELRFPVPSELFESRRVSFLGCEIPTVDPRVLLHTFGTIGGVIRRKDVPKIVRLADAIAAGVAVSTFSEEQCAVFSRYAIARKRRYPVFIAAKQTWEEAQIVIPTRAVRALEHHLLPVAQRIMGEMNRERPGRPPDPPRPPLRRGRGR